MKKVVFFAFFALVFQAKAQNKTNKGTTQAMTPKDSLSYALGMNIASNMQGSGISDLNFTVFNQAIQDVLGKKKLAFDSEKANAVLQAAFQKIQTQQFEAKIAEGKKFLEENKKQAGVIALPSGLQFKVVQDGAGEMPKATDKVKVHYKGTLLNGTTFDSSYDRGEPIVLNVNSVIQGWQEALQMMKVGSKWQIYVPYTLGYGERGAGQSIAPYETLVFDIELLGIEK